MTLIQAVLTVVALAQDSSVGPRWIIERDAPDPSDTFIAWLVIPENPRWDVAILEQPAGGRMWFAVDPVCHATGVTSRRIARDSAGMFRVCVSIRKRGVGRLIAKLEAGQVQTPVVSSALDIGKPASEPSWLSPVVSFAAGALIALIAAGLQYFGTRGQEERASMQKRREEARNALNSVVELLDVELVTHAGILNQIKTSGVAPEAFLTESAVTLFGRPTVEQMLNDLGQGAFLTNAKRYYALLQKYNADLQDFHALREEDPALSDQDLRRRAGDLLVYHPTLQPK